MVCCENTVCIDIFVSPCAETINTKLITTAAGNWKIFIEFNGTYKRLIIPFQNNEVIVLPNVFNENYAHTVKIYKPDDTLFNDTCYTFNMCLTIDATSNPITPATQTTDITYVIKDNPNPNIGDGTPDNPYQLQSGNTVTIPILLGQLVHFPIVYNTGQEYIAYDAPSTTFNRSLNGGFNNNDIMTISYEKTV